eukprot:jgi/Psemu1/312615/fgenesh1_kg.990_\
METAEQRDLNMFYRLVNGIRERQMNLIRENEASPAAVASEHALTEAEHSLEHIIHTRNAPVDRRSGGSNTRRTNSHNIDSYRNLGLNSGISILEENSEEQDDNEWSLAGFDSSSNLSLGRRQHDSYQHQRQSIHHQPQHQSAFLYHDYSVGGGTLANFATAPSSTTLHSSQSSGNIVDEGMFDFEL